MITRTILPTEAAPLREFVGGMRGAIHVVFEEGTQAQWLHELLSPRVDRVVVCDRRGDPRRGNKGDWVDAEQLSDRLRRGDVRGVYHGGAHRVTLKELTRAYRNLVEDSTRVMLRLKALFARGRFRRRAPGSISPAGGRPGWGSSPNRARGRGGRPVCRARRAPRAAAAGEGRDAGGGPSRSGVAGPAHHSVLGAGAGRAAARDAANAVAVPDQAALVGVHGAGGADALDGGLPVGGRPAAAPAPRPKRGLTLSSRRRRPFRVAFPAHERPTTSCWLSTVDRPRYSPTTVHPPRVFTRPLCLLGSRLTQRSAHTARPNSRTRPDMRHHVPFQPEVKALAGLRATDSRRPGHAMVPSKSPRKNHELPAVLGLNPHPEPKGPGTIGTSPPDDWQGVALGRQYHDLCPCKRRHVRHCNHRAFKLEQVRGRDPDVGSLARDETGRC